jgi:hypothetical protein
MGPSDKHVEEGQTWAPQAKSSRQAGALENGSMDIVRRSSSLLRQFVRNKRCSPPEGLLRGVFDKRLSKARRVCLSSEVSYALSN